MKENDKVLIDSMWAIFLIFPLSFSILTVLVGGSPSQSEMRTLMFISIFGNILWVIIRQMNRNTKENYFLNSRNDTLKRELEAIRRENEQKD